MHSLMTDNTMKDVKPHGWLDGKFVVKHYRRGDLLDGEAFVLVPERDPAAIVALRAYADATPDPDLAERLRAWTMLFDEEARNTPTIDDKLPSWIASLSGQVESGEIDVTQALFRIARLVRRGECELP